MRASPEPVDPRLVAALAVVAAAFYVLLLCPEAYWGDGASLSSHLDAVPTPFTRSYWMYRRSALVLVAFGLEPALAANATSALYGAMGVGAAAALVLRLGGGRIGACVGAGSLAVAHTWWSASEVAEVYTLHGVIFLGLLILGLGTSRRSMLALGLLAGLSLNHHRMILPASAIAVVFACRRQPAHRGALLTGLGIGSVPWLALCAAFPPSSLTPPEGVDRGVLWLQRALFGGSRSAGEFLPFGTGLPQAWARMLRFVVLNFPGPALLLALPGARWLAQRDRGAAWMLAALVAGGLAVATSMRWAGDAQVYLLTIHPVLAVLAGLGMGALWSRRRTLAASTGALAVLGPPALYAALAFTPAGGLLLPEQPETERAEFLWPGRRGWVEGSRWWGQTAPSLPANAVVLSRWREGTVLEYRQRILGLRTDLDIELAVRGPHLLAEPARPTFVTWTPVSDDVPDDVAQLDLLLQGEQRGLRRVVPWER